ncbi:MAG: hypothetical protein HOE86_19005, partial [Gemmatimonadetes bacterium]|nr:hypothetical protein [Gemmatimonadota bacterium]
IPPVRDWDSPYGSSFFVWVVDPSRFGGAEALAHRCAALVDAAHGVPAAAGHDTVLVPGDRARSCRAQRLKEGIPVHRLHWEAILKRLDACDLNISCWRR